MKGSQVYDQMRLRFRHLTYQLRVHTSLWLVQSNAYILVVAVSSYKIPCRVTARNRLYIIGQGYSTYLDRRKLSVGNKFEQLDCTYS